MVELDPKIVDQETLRLERRGRLFRNLVVPIIGLFVAGLFFIRPGLASLIGNGAFEGGNASLATSAFGQQRTLNIIESYIAYYNTGTALLREGNIVEAEKELQESLNLLPPLDKICQVRVNLAYSVELQADKLKNKGDESKAAVLYNRALGILYGNNCASPLESIEPNDVRANEAEERIERKLHSEYDVDGDEDEDGKEEPGQSDEYYEGFKEDLLDSYSVRDKIRSDKSYDEWWSNYSERLFNDTLKW